MPVLLEEALEWLQPADGGLYVDATLGLGGHGRAILEAAAPGGRLIGFEWDSQAAQLAGENLVAFADRLQIVPLSYIELEKELARLHIEAVDGLIADLGVSSLQLDRPERGFSFLSDAPLDMRMDRSRQMDAAGLLATLSEEQLADLFYYYGEERQARRIARHLAQAREQEALSTTKQLARLVAAAVPRKYHPRRVHVATKVFQALRIAVNGELDNIRALLAQAPAVLRPGGRIAVITFHSLEDRLVKQAFEHNPMLQPLHKKPLEPHADETRRNPRARSAKMRVAQRL
ncbi:MAG: 16S rRNA (cytosine(1402)-N(4))-methyltransferase RsmH [bacterium]|nr:16S rRNA (cytosine(1402)-N(4))-methyltransferase RsmH [bacterium]